MANIFIFVESKFLLLKLSSHNLRLFSSYNHYGSAITLLNVRQEQMQALKQIPKQDYEVDIIDDNRQTLIDQERVKNSLTIVGFYYGKSF